MHVYRSDFPPDFAFGVATSAYQIEGHSFGGAGPTHWDSFAATPGNVVRAEDGQIACDHYHRWAEDLDLVAALGVDVYRFSTSWARVLPEGLGTPNSEGLDFYDRIVDGMLERGLKPALTLYHWELPQALADQGGWRNGDMHHWFAEFTNVVMQRIGDRLWSVAPINEPWCVAWLSHFDGLHAPGLRDIRATARAMHHVLKAHGAAISVMRDMGQKNLGAVFNFEWSTPATQREEDVLAAQRYDAIYNRFFAGGVFHKRYPELALEGLEPHLPKNWQEDLEDIGAPLDWVGINYYTRKRVAASKSPWPSYQSADPQLATTQMGWEIYPQGLEDFILRMRDEYSGALPIYITENGMAHPDQPTQPDKERIAYLAAHLHAVANAQKKGAPVKGYYYWSLLDNYEWSLGYEKRFGLIHVDFDTQERRPKASFDALREFLSGENALT